MPQDPQLLLSDVVSEQITGITDVDTKVVKVVEVNVAVVPTFDIVIVVLIVEVTVTPVSSGRVVIVVGVLSVVYLVAVDVRTQAGTFMTFAK